MKKTTLLTILVAVIATRTADGFSLTTSHHRSKSPLALPRESSAKWNTPSSSAFERCRVRVDDSFSLVKKKSSKSWPALGMSKNLFPPFSSKSLYKTELPPTIQSNLSTLIQWIIFALSIVGISYSFHAASLHEWLGIGSSTWDTASKTYPSVIALSCIYNLVQFSMMQGGGGGAIATMMGGTVVDDDSSSSHDLKKALLEVYEASELPMEDDKGMSLVPELYLIPAKEPNAFAAGGYFGRKGQVVALTTGLLERLDMTEVRAVIAHEVGHLRNRDTVKALQLACMIAALGSIINIAMRMVERELFWNSASSNDDEDEDENSGGVNLVLAAILFASGAITYSVGNLLRLASSRSVEYDADAFAKSIGAGDDLVSALEKISKSNNEKYERDSEGLGLASGAFAHSYVNNPPSRESPIINLCGFLRTHPTTAQRVERLQSEEE